MKNAKYWIEKLGLIRHPEGGYFREIYRSEEIIPSEILPGAFSGPRNLSTSIYFLLEGPDFSCFHRLKSDELWHFYYGSKLTLHIIEPDGNCSNLALGPGPERNETFQAVVKAGSWFAASVPDAETYTLAGCTMSPGFDFADFEMGKKEQLTANYPQFRSLIEKFTK